MNQTRTLIWKRFLTYVWEYTDGTIEVNTPVKIERGFDSREQAVEFAESWGFVDNRKAEVA